MLIIISSHCADTADVTENLDILSEIRILKQVGQHRNIVSFIGACINSGKCWWGRNYVHSNLCSEASPGIRLPTRDMLQIKKLLQIK